MSVKKQIINKAAQIIKAISNEKRLQVLYLIADNEMNVGEIMKAVNLSQSALSQHLAVLRSYDIVKTRRNAQIIYYTLKDERMKKILALLEELF